MVAQPPSIVRVAELAGVSVATASRVMSSSGYPVSEATRQKVLKAASELNYIPNLLARSLKAQRSKLIAVLVGDSADPYFAQIMRGVEEVANEHGYLTILCNTDRNPARELHYLRTLQDYRADGVIFAGGGLSMPGYPERIDEIVKEMQRRGAAVIALSQHALHVPSVQADNFTGAHLMTSRLIALGHRRIAFVMGPTNLTVATVRLQGYMAALAEAGITINPNLLLSGNFDQASGEQAVRGLMQSSVDSRPTAIFAANDETAFGVIIGLRRQGCNIPRDISVCGFGDLPMAQVVAPSLTTVQIALRELGRTGALRLLALLRDEQIPDLEMLPTTIIERESTAPLPAGHR